MLAIRLQSLAIEGLGLWTLFLATGATWVQLRVNSSDVSQGTGKQPSDFSFSPFVTLPACRSCGAVPKKARGAESWRTWSPAA